MFVVVAVGGGVGVGDFFGDDCGDGLGGSIPKSGDPKLDNVVVDDDCDWFNVGGGVDVKLIVAFGGDFMLISNGEINRDFAAGSPSVWILSKVQSFDTFSTSSFNSAESVSASERSSSER